jgi:SAM-dependent methyltransferase
MTRSVGRADWDDYIQRFHEDRPGITEAVLTRATSHGQNPYEWLIDGHGAPGVVLDLACGSAPARPLLGPHWIGLDASARELRAARLDTTGRAVRADLTRLPIDSETCDTIICSMALMLIEPLPAALHEMKRVLRPDGVIRILLPATSPLTTRDRLRYTRLLISLRTTTLFPSTPLHHDAEGRLRTEGLRIVDDTARLFAYPIRAEADGALLVDSLYLPNCDAERRAAACRVAGRWRQQPIGIALRRLTATQGECR